MILLTTDGINGSFNSNGNLNKTNCTMDIDGRQLVNGESVELKGKIYKMEECRLERAYHACGRHLFKILHIVCDALRHERQMKNSHRIQKRFSRRKLLTDACCLALCTVHEMTRYCPLI